MAVTTIKQEISDELIEIDPTSSLIVKVEVQEDEMLPEDESSSITSKVSETQNLNFSCPKCHVPYPKLLSFRNHVAVCQRNQFK